MENDPIDLAGGLNRYGYVRGSPLSSTDSMGLFPDSVTMTCARNPAFCAEAGIVVAGTAAAMSIPRPRNMTSKEEGIYDKYCNNSEDPCKTLKEQTDQAINYAKDKMRNLLKDKNNLFGTQGWTTHINDLNGKIGRINNMISLGEKMGCDMTAQRLASKELAVPDAPRPWWRIF